MIVYLKDPLVVKLIAFGAGLLCVVVGVWVMPGDAGWSLALSGAATMGSTALQFVPVEAREAIRRASQRPPPS